MDTYAWIFISLAAFDLFLLVLFYRQLRASPSMNRSLLKPVGGGIVGFIFHAFLFFSGPILFLQLATYVAIFGLVLTATRKQDKRSC